MHPRLAELSEHLARERRTLLDVAAAIPTDSWQTRPTDSSWSASEIVEHLYKVERGTAALLTKRVTKARAEGHPAETETSSVMGTVDHLRVSDRTRTLVAPEIAVPTESPDRETSLHRLAESRAALLAAVEQADGLALGSIRHTHLRLGELDLYQWILVIAEHEKRHTAQLRDVARQLAPAS